MSIGDYFIYAFPVVLLELFAALAGIYYLKRVPVNHKRTKYLIWFLWFSFSLEVIASYAVIAYFSEYKYFSFILNTPIERNTWLYNIYYVVSPVFFMYYFSSFLRSLFAKKLFYYASIVFVVSSIAYLVFSETYFVTNPAFVSFTGTFLILTAITFFYFELLKSNAILMLRRYLPFYISLGILVFSLCNTPLTIFTKYFSSSTGNHLFINLHIHVVLFSSIFMYSCYIFGFLICSKKKKYS